MQDQISGLIRDFSLEHVPLPAIDCAHKLLADTVAVTIAGSQMTQYRLAEKALTEMGSNSTGQFRPVILGIGRKQLSVCDGVMLNGISAHSADFNDLFYGLPGHPSAVLVPVVLGLGEFIGSNGKQILEAYILAMELQSRVNQALMPIHHEKGFHSTSVAGVLGAAIAASKLLKLDKASTENALAIACTMACGLRRNFGTYANSFHVGNAAANGLKAAFLARSGYTAETNIMFLEDGYMHAFYGSPDHLAASLTSFGTTWAYQEPGILIKKYPSCYSTYLAIDAALNIRRKYSPRIAEIAEIQCLASELTIMSLPNRWTDSVYGERFCIPYCIAAALKTGEIRLDSFTEEMLSDEQIISLRDRIVCGVHPRLVGVRGQGFTEIRIRMKDGTEFCDRQYPQDCERVEHWAEGALYSKFMDCTAKRIGSERAVQLFESCFSIEKTQNMQNFFDLLF